MTTRLASLSSAWHSAKVLRTREKVSFFLSVHNLLLSALLFAMAPQYVISRMSELLADPESRWVHISYTLQSLYLLPMRAYQYKKRSWHYFLFDLCYYVNVLVSVSLVACIPW
jgi:hypothetical protein